MKGLSFGKTPYPYSMALETWSESTGVPAPKCKMQGCCCRAASPSVPYHQLLEKAANGETFAQNFFSIFLPYANHEEARQVVPGLVERTLKAAQKDDNFKSEEDVVFYHCRYISDDNKCQIWEDRPELCRSYPDTPYMVFAPGCAFEPWSKAVKEKFENMKKELEHLKTLRDELQTARNSGQPIDPRLFASDNLESLSTMLSLTPTYLVSPLISYLE